MVSFAFDPPTHRKKMKKIRYDMIIEIENFNY